MRNIQNSLSAALVLLLAVALFFSCSTSEKKTSSTPAVDSTQVRVERGKYLAHIVSSCLDCHSQRDFTQFSGPVVEGTEGMGGFAFDQKFNVPGVVYARNITPDTANGIGNWTDAEITRAFTQGISRNGDTLFPLMPYVHFNGMSKDDVKSIVAFLRTLKPNSNKVPERKLGMPVSMAYPPLQNESVERNVRPDETEIVKYGGYMVNIAACMDCHTQMEKGQFVMSKMFGGGYLFDMGTFKVNSANISPDSATGIGKWTEEMFLDKFKNYRDPVSFKNNPGKNNSIMPWSVFAQMDDFDIKAIYRYLKTIPPVNNAVVKYP